MITKDIEPKLKTIGEYLGIKDNPFFVIPEYQRAYSWAIYQCDKLWQDIEEYLGSDNDDPYFFGTVIIDCSNQSGELHLIDGQQRTTTFLLLLKAMLIRLDEVLKVFVQSEDSEALGEGLRENRNRAIEILYKADRTLRTEIIRDWSKVQGRISIKTRSINELYENDLSIILESKTYQEAESKCHKFARKQKDNKYTNFFRNFKYFYERLKAYSESRVNSFADGFLDKCQIIEIRSWQTEQAITMFNSLNSTGLPLSDADIISAQMYSKSGDKRELFHLKWEEIIKKSSELDSYKVTDLDSLLQQYMYIFRAQNRDYIKDIGDGKISVNVTTPGLRKFYISEHNEILSNPISQCNNFLKIARIWEEIKDYQEVRLLLKFNENSKLYLISYLYRYEPKCITHEIVTEICEMIIRLFAILELVDSGYSSANFKSFLFKEIVKMVDPNISIEEIKSDFDEHIQKTWNKDILYQSLLDYDKNILAFLNEYLYAKEHNISFEFADSVNVEHIMPASGHNIDAIREDARINSKDEFVSIVNKLGNKILLEEDINKSIGKDWFKTKKRTSISEKRGYKDSKFGIAQALAKYSNDLWTKDDIDAATQRVADRISTFITGVEDESLFSERHDGKTPSGASIP